MSQDFCTQCQSFVRQRDSGVRLFVYCWRGLRGRCWLDGCHCILFHSSSLIWLQMAPVLRAVGGTLPM